MSDWTVYAGTTYLPLEYQIPDWPMIDRYRRSSRVLEWGNIATSLWRRPDLYDVFEPMTLPYRTVARESWSI